MHGEKLLRRARDSSKFLAQGSSRRSRPATSETVAAIVGEAGTAVATNTRWTAVTWTSQQALCNG